jgi:uncharacterized protein (TIGR00725 family)
MLISVIGGKDCAAEEERIAEEVGAELGRRGITLVCGGLGGVMEAACRGARSAGGTTVGVLPGSSREAANPYVDIPIVTGMGEARNVIVAFSGQAVIAIDGEYGTLSEIAHARRAGIPVVGLNTWSLSNKGKEDDSIIVAASAKEAVEKAVAAIERNGGR